MEKVMQAPISSLENLKIIELLDNENLDSEIRMEFIVKLGEMCSQAATFCKNLSVDPMALTKRFQIHQVYR